MRVPVPGGGGGMRDGLGPPSWSITRETRPADDSLLAVKQADTLVGVAKLARTA